MKYVKILRTLAVALTLAMLAAVVPATPALAQAAYLDVSPNQGEIDDDIDIYGNWFNTSATVYIYFSSDPADEGDRLDYEVEAYQHVRTVGTSATGEFYSYFTVPDELTHGDDEENVRGGTYYVYATYSGSRTILAVDQFTVEAVGEITLVDPEEGTVGTEVEITGKGFADREDIIIEYDGDEVDIESGDDDTDRDGEFQSTIIIPESTAGSHTITVIGDDSGIEVEATFTVEPKITISPESGAAGDTITLSGTGFGARFDLSILFANVEVLTDETARTSRSGSFEVTFAALSKEAGNYDVEAEDEDDNFATVRFTMVAAAPPAAISVSATTGNIGDKVTISGTGFEASHEITITFGSTEVIKVTSGTDGSFSTSFTVPAGAAGSHVIQVSDGTSTKKADFTILPTTASISPTTSSASPGNVGTELTVSGIGFVAGETVKITYDGNQVATATVSTDGGFSAKFPVPASSGGEHTIIAADTTNTKQFTFVMESKPPPIPVPLKPEMDIKVESEVFFDWEDVTDPSGVTYTLQIATEEDFSKELIVLEKKGLTQSEYTITTEEALESVSKKAPYYWHVKAVDSAFNDSRWSGTGTFYVGSSFSLAQSVIYTLFGIGALILGIFGFWLGRKTAYY